MDVNLLLIAGLAMVIMFTNGRIELMRKRIKMLEELMG